MSADLPLASQATDRIPLSTTRSRLAVASLAMGSFASVTAEFLPVGVLPEVARAFEVSPGSAGLMMTLPGLLAAVSAPAVMVFAGDRDRRNILLLLSGLLVVSSLMSALAPTFWIMLMGRAFTGVSLGAFWAMGLAVAVRLVAAESAQKAAAAVFAGVTAAMILGVPLGTLIAEQFSWRGAFHAAAAIAVLAALMQLASLPPVPAKSSLRFADLIKAAAPAPARNSMGMIALIFAAHFGAYTYVAPMLEKAALTSSAITGVLLGYGVAGFIATFVAGRYVTSHPRHSLYAGKMMLIIPLISLPFLLSMPKAEVALVVVWGLAWGALPLSLNTWNRNASNSNGEATAALFTFTGQVAIAMGSGAGGWVVDHLGLNSTFFIAAVAVVASMLLLGISPVRQLNQGGI